MARDVTFEDVRRRIREFDNRATSITVNDDGQPHAVSVEVHLGAERLIVEVDDGRGLFTASIVVERGILHRLAGVPGSGPTCVALGET